MTILHTRTTTNIQEKSNLIWTIGDLFKEYYKSYEYGKVLKEFGGIAQEG